MDKRYCPHCGSDQRGERIPQVYIDNGYYSGKDPYYYRTMGEVDMDIDMVVSYTCPDCGGTWAREGISNTMMHDTVRDVIVQWEGR